MLENLPLIVLGLAVVLAAPVVAEWLQEMTKEKP